MLNEFLDPLALGLAPVREKLAGPFDWSIEHPQTNYPALQPIAPEVRAKWHPMINQFYLYWGKKAAHRGLIPDRGDLDPLLEIPHLCRRLCIIEPRTRPGRGPDWYCRLIGTEVDTAMGGGTQGQFLSELNPNPDPQQRARYSLAIDENIITYRCGPPRFEPSAWAGRIATLYAPISDQKLGLGAAIGVAICEAFNS